MNRPLVRELRSAITSADTLRTASVHPAHPARVNGRPRRHRATTRSTAVPAVEVSPALRAPHEGVNVLQLYMGSQSGTHVDAPHHVDDTWSRLDELPLGRFAGHAMVADVRGLPARAPITPELLVPVLSRLRPGSLVLLASGWSAYWGTEHYLAHPWLTPEAAEALVGAGVRTVAVDAPSVDPTPRPGDVTADFGLPAHRVLCGADGVIAENLTGLEQLVGVEDVELFLFPLRLSGADGAPVRAVARTV